MKDVFSKFSPELQKAIKKFGLKKPTDIQYLSVDPILEGKNVLLISKTGTGKTLAAMLPIFDMWLKTKPEPISILYITPLRSLNRDHIEHMMYWSQELGLEATVRHGDTSQYERRMQVEFPDDLMISTPETLQAILPGKKIKEHLKNIKWCVLDDCHEIVDSKRGTQLTVALERLRELCGHDFQI
ncbi:MAG: DEAD/DEAH box helicase, partial [Candidatus Heimdallarchaeota archaeon]